MLICHCGGTIKITQMGNGKTKYACQTCLHTYYGGILYPEKSESKTKSVPLRIAQIKLRDDNGPTNELSPPEQFIELTPGKFYDVKAIKSVPAMHAGQLGFCDE